MQVSFDGNVQIHVLFYNFCSGNFLKENECEEKCILNNKEIKVSKHFKIIENLEIQTDECARLSIDGVC